MEHGFNFGGQELVCV